MQQANPQRLRGSAQGRDGKEDEGVRGRRRKGRETISRTRTLRSFPSSSDIGVPLRRLGLRRRGEAGIPRDPVQQGQQLAHGRDDRPLVRMALRPLLAVVAAEDRVPLDRCDRRHVERVAHVLSPAPDPPLPFPGSALPLLGSDAGKPVELPVGERPDLRQAGKYRYRREVSDAADLREPLPQAVHAIVLPWILCGY